MPLTSIKQTNNQKKKQLFNYVVCPLRKKKCLTHLDDSTTVFYRSSTGKNMSQKKNLSLRHILDILLKFRKFQRKKKANKKGRPINPPNELLLPNKQTVLLVSTYKQVILQCNRLSPCMVVWLCSPLEISYELGLSVEQFTFGGVRLLFLTF